MPSIQLIPGVASDSQKTVLINNALQQIINDQTTKIYKDAQGVNSILIGLDTDKKAVIKVAKPGKNVLEASNNDLIFNSAQNILKIAGQGTVIIPVTSGSGAVATVNHSLGYAPMIMASFDLFNDGSQLVQMPYSLNGLNLYSVATPTTVEFRMSRSNTSAPSSPYSVKYYLLSESAQ